MKKKLFILSILLLGIIVWVAYLYHNKVEPLWGEDLLSIEVTSPLATENVKIEYGFNTINRKNDAELFKDRERYSVIFDGKIKDSLATDYGENDFLITYNNQYYFSFRQFKTWRKSYHKYDILIHQNDSIPILKVDIFGDNEMHFERRMIPIALAQYYVVNTPTDSAGIMYKVMKIATPDVSEAEIEKSKKEEEEFIKKMNSLLK